MSDKAAGVPSPVRFAVPARTAGSRRKPLHRLVTEHGFVAVAAIAQEIGVFDRTVRRDLDALACDATAVTEFPLPPAIREAAVRVGATRAVAAEADG